jgi:hypothetical protein
MKFLDKVLYTPHQYPAIYIGPSVFTMPWVLIHFVNDNCDLGWADLKGMLTCELELRNKVTAFGFTSRLYWVTEGDLKCLKF